MKIIRIEAPGKHYRLVPGEADRPAPGPGEMLIRVAAAGLNRADLLQGRGLYPPPPGASEIPGMEVSGTVAALGEGVEGFPPGSPVCALLPSGGYAEYAVANSAAVLGVPANVDLVAAAGLPEAAFTAWTNIADTGRLAAGETLLVHGGTSGVGSLAIQIFAVLGHRVFATAGTPEKCAACEKFGAIRAIDYRAADFVQAALAATAGRGVDVILDMVGGDYIARNLAAAAPGGRIVNIAYQEGSRAELDFAPMLKKHLTLAATTLRPRNAAEKGAIRDALAARVWPLLAVGRIQPVIDRIFPFSEANAAHRAMAEGGHIGKILLVPG
jgi:putative PIG3 family NAD(P)H quinone oxidoreductase